MRQRNREGETERQRDRETKRQRDRERQRDRQTQTDRETDRQTERQTDRRARYLEFLDIRFTLLFTFGIHIVAVPVVFNISAISVVSVVPVVNRVIRISIPVGSVVRVAELGPELGN